MSQSIVTESAAADRPVGGIAEAFLGAVSAASARTEPYRHWLLQEALPESACAAIEALPFPAADIGDTAGRRETHNAFRRFFDVDARDRFPVCHELAAVLQDPGTVGAIERLCDVSLAGSSLRIEYCQDRAGFWLEPHTDIGAKLFTMLIYLSEGPGSAAWGTDIYADGGKTWVGRAPYARRRGLIFVPGHDTWHGFAPRPVAGVRRSLIVNYVASAWRARHELAYPDTPVA